MNQPFGTRRWAGLFGLGLAIGLTAGWRSANAQEMAPPAAVASSSAPASSPVAGQHSAVAEAAWSHLQLLRNYVHASRQRDPQRRAAEFTQARKDLVAAAHLGDLTPQETETFATLWPALVSHYVDGFQKDRLVVPQMSEKEATAIVIAVNPEDQKTADELAAKIRGDLQKEGLSGQDLRSREQVLLKRQLADRGIGLPLAATIQLRLVNVNGAWKLRSVNLLPPGGASATRPVVGSVPRAPRIPATGSATQPGH